MAPESSQREWSIGAGSWRFDRNGLASCRTDGPTVDRIGWRIRLGPRDDPHAGAWVRPGECEVRARFAADRVDAVAVHRASGLRVGWGYRRRADGVGARLSYHLTGRMPVREVVFPEVDFRPSDAGAFATVPFSTGYRLPVDALREGERIVLNYPVHASMSWTSVCDRGRSFYVGAHDPETWLRRLCFRRRAGGLSVALRWPDLAGDTGDRWQTPEIVLAADDEGWERGARRYREWAARCMRFVDPPPWFAETPVWAWVGMRGQNAPDIDARYADLPAIAARLRAAGIPVPQVAGWLEHGHDTRYPEYAAGRSLGGDRGLGAAVDTIHGVDGRMSLYTNGRLIDPAGPLGGAADWQRMCVRIDAASAAAAVRTSGTFRDPTPWDPSGGIAKERYGDVTFAVGCPGSTAWREVLADRLASVVERYGVDGLYIDQVAGCSSLACGADGHDHARPGLAWRGYLALIAGLRARIRAVRPDAYLATEGVADLFGQVFDAQQAHNDWRHQVLDRAGDMPELFRTTFPELLVLVGPIAADGDDRWLRLGHVYGTGLDLFDPSEPVPRPFADALAAYAKLRRRSLPWLCRGRPVEGGVRVDGDRLAAFGFVRDDDRAVCVHAARLGAGDGATAVTVPVASVRATARMEGADGKAETIECARDRSSDGDGRDRVRVVIPGHAGTGPAGLLRIVVAPVD